MSEARVNWIAGNRCEAEGCSNPSAVAINVSAAMASSVASRFELRCDEHNPYRFSAVSGADYQRLEAENAALKADLNRAYQQMEEDDDEIERLKAELAAAREEHASLNHIWAAKLADANRELAAARAEIARLEQVCTERYDKMLEYAKESTGYEIDAEQARAEADRLRPVAEAAREFVMHRKTWNGLLGAVEAWEEAERGQ